MGWKHWVGKASILTIRMVQLRPLEDAVTVPSCIVEMDNLPGIIMDEGAIDKRIHFFS